MERSLSVPANPFWSNRAAAEWELARRRPRELGNPSGLPVPDDDFDVCGESPKPVESGARGSRRRSRSPPKVGHGDSAGSGNVRTVEFKTPPSSWTTQGGPGLWSRGGKSEGKMPSFSEGPAPEAGAGGQSLEEAFGEHLVQELLDQNQKLQEKFVDYKKVLGEHQLHGRQ